MSDRNRRSHRGKGNGMATHGKRMQHEKPPTAETRDLPPESREGQAGPRGVADRLVVPWKPVNAGGGKGPEFKTDVRKSLRTRRLA